MDLNLSFIEYFSGLDYENYNKGCSRPRLIVETKMDDKNSKTIIELKKVLFDETLDKVDSALGIKFYSNYLTNNFGYENQIYFYDFENIFNEISKLFFRQPIKLNDSVIVINNNDMFYIKVVFNFMGCVSVIVAHSTDEFDKSPLESSDIPCYRLITVYLSKVFAYYIKQYGAAGILFFFDWVKNYENIHTAQCSKCGLQLSQEEVQHIGVLVIPVIRDVDDGKPYHICCSPTNEKLGDIGFQKLDLRKS